jgi:hypothetical protein
VRVLRKRKPKAPSSSSRQLPSSAPLSIAPDSDVVLAAAVLDGYIKADVIVSGRIDGID